MTRGLLRDERAPLRERLARAVVAARALKQVASQKEMAAAAEVRYLSSEVQNAAPNQVRAARASLEDAIARATFAREKASRSEAEAARGIEHLIAELATGKSTDLPVESWTESGDAGWSSVLAAAAESDVEPAQAQKFSAFRGAEHLQRVGAVNSPFGIFSPETDYSRETSPQTRYLSSGTDGSSKNASPGSSPKERKVAPRRIPAGSTGRARLARAAAALPVRNETTSIQAARNDSPDLDSLRAEVDGARSAAAAARERAAEAQRNATNEVVRLDRLAVTRVPQVVANQDSIIQLKVDLQTTENRATDLENRLQGALAEVIAWREEHSLAEASAAGTLTQMRSELEDAALALAAQQERARFLAAEEVAILKVDLERALQEASLLGEHQSVKERATAAEVSSLQEKLGAEQRAAATLEMQAQHTKKELRAAHDESQRLKEIASQTPQLKDEIHRLISTAKVDRARLEATHQSDLAEVRSVAAVRDVSTSAIYNMHLKSLQTEVAAASRAEVVASVDAADLRQQITDLSRDLGEADGLRKREVAATTAASTVQLVSMKHEIAEAQQWQAEYCQAAAEIEFSKAKLEVLQEQMTKLNLSTVAEKSIIRLEVDQTAIKTAALREEYCIALADAAVIRQQLADHTQSSRLGEDEAQRWKAQHSKATEESRVLEAQLGRVKDVALAQQAEAEMVLRAERDAAIKEADTLRRQMAKFATGAAVDRATFHVSNVEARRFREERDNLLVETERLRQQLDTITKAATVERQALASNQLSRGVPADETTRETVAWMSASSLVARAKLRAHLGHAGEELRRKNMQENSFKFQVARLTAESVAGRVAHKVSSDASADELSRMWEQLNAKEREMMALKRSEVLNAALASSNPITVSEGISTWRKENDGAVVEAVAKLSVHSLVRTAILAMEQ